MTEKLNATTKVIKKLEIKESFKKYAQDNGYRIPVCVKERKRKVVVPLSVGAVAPQQEVTAPSST